MADMMVNIDQGKVLEYIKEFLRSIEENNFDVTNKRNTLKSRVKQLALQYKLPKDFANYITLFLMVTKFFYIENKEWKVNTPLLSRLDKPGFIYRNLFKFLFYTRDYNEYYKQPLVLNTVFSANDFDVINKRRCILDTLSLCYDEDRMAFSQVYDMLTKRYAFFRDYNNPQTFYYTKGDVFTNRQFIFLVLFKTLFYMGVVQVEKKSKSVVDYHFRVTEYGRALIESYFYREKENIRKKQEERQQRVMLPYSLLIPNNKRTPMFKMMFNSLVPREEAPLEMAPSTAPTGNRDHNFLYDIRHQIIKKVQEENIPNLLV